MAECDCRDDCCLEIVPVTVNNNSITIDGAGLAMVVTSVSPTESNIVITMDVADYFDVKCWFQDSAIPGASPSVVPPPTPGSSQFNVVTDANGTFTINVQNAGALDTWYLCTTIGNGVVISTALTLGV